MSHPSPISEQMIRHACEPCRRKKTKCTAERPTCSFCQRLKITCSYLPRGSTHNRGIKRKASIFTSRKSELASTKDRVRELESQVNTLYGLLGSSSSHLQVETPVGTLVEEAASYSKHEFESNSSTGLLNARRSSDALPLTSTMYEPSLDALEHFVHVYGTHLHLQPLPLFRLENLADQLLHGARYLLWSFLALTMTLSSHSFYNDQAAAARNFYARSSEDIVMKLAFQGVSKPEVTQSLCLIALRYIKIHEPARAWMAIGAASRLHTLGILHHEDESPAYDDSASRAYWSVFMLERLFVPFTADLTSVDTPAYPSGAHPIPSYSSALRKRDGFVPNRQGTAVEAPSREIGIIEHFLRLTSIWGRIKSYLHQLRHGDVEKPWLCNSTHMKLGLELTEFELNLGRPHVLDTVAFPKRTAEEISQNIEYWNPWMTGQILWHAAQAMLNHPFIHIVVMRSKFGVPVSCLFLQQKVDLALYQASWVFRLIELSRPLLDIDNPLIGDAVLATATVLFLFQFSRKPEVAQRAREDLDQCDRFLSRMALSWPHIQEKLGILRQLQALAAENRPKVDRQDVTISFKSVWFWALLIPGILPPTKNNSPSANPSPDTGNDSDVQMCLRSHHITPLEKEHESDTEEQGFDSAAANPRDSFLMNLDDVEHFNIDELSFDFLQDDFLW